MSGEYLFREIQCERCGRTRMKEASFCPHCGYAEEESWWKRVANLFRGSAGANKTTSSALLSAFLGLAVASFFLFEAIRKESVASLAIALVAIIAALRAWFSTRNRVEEATDPARPPRSGESGGEEPLSLEDDESEHSTDPLETILSGQKFFCENCGNEVREDARECPKCGMKFG
jgi:rubrerythrin